MAPSLEQSEVSELVLEHFLDKHTEEALWAVRSLYEPPTDYSSSSEDDTEGFDSSDDTDYTYDTPTSDIFPDTPDSPIKTTLEQARQGLEGDGHAADVKEIFRIEKVKGKGLGMVATGAIHRGQLILAEEPSLQFSRYARDTEIRGLFFPLAAHVKKLLLQLSNCCGTGANIIDIVYTNAIPLTGTKDQAGLFARASRINHACNPNTNKSWSPETGKMSFYATRDIQPGEEITSTYIDELETYRDRQSHLCKMFRFTCSCDLCSLDFPRRVCSDFHISDMKNVKKNLRGLLKGASLGSRLPAIRHLLRLYDEQSITDARVARAYADAYKTAVRYRDGHRALAFARRSAKLFTEVEGEDGRQAKRMTDQIVQMQKLVEEFAPPLPFAVGEESDDWLFMGGEFQEGGPVSEDTGLSWT